MVKTIHFLYTLCYVCVQQKAIKSPAWASLAERTCQMLAWTRHQQSEKHGVQHKAVNTNTPLWNTAVLHSFSWQKHGGRFPFVGAFDSPSTWLKAQIYRNAQINEWFVCSPWIQNSLLLSKHIYKIRVGYNCRVAARWLNKALRVLKLQLTGLWQWTCQNHMRPEVHSQQQLPVKQLTMKQLTVAEQS